MSDLVKLTNRLTDKFQIIILAFVSISTILQHQGSKPQPIFLFSSVEWDFSDSIFYPIQDVKIPGVPLL